jgi:probable HAF family extracellular repeat protein
MRTTNNWTAVALVLTVTPSWAASRYTTVDLGPTTAFNVTGYNGLNERGQVAGFIYGTGDNSASGNHPTTQAAIYSNGRATGLGTLGGTNSYANGMNSAGEVIGFSYLTGNAAYHAAIFLTHGRPFDLGTLGGTRSAAYSINEAGVATGVAYLQGDTVYRAADFTIGGPPIDLGTLGGAKSAALGINNRGQSVGFAYLADGTTYHASLFAVGHSPLDLGSLGNDSWAYAINDSGLVVGYSIGPVCCATHAVLFRISGGPPIDLGDAPSQAFGINGVGGVVGFATVGGQGHGALWTRAGGVWTLTDLNTVIDPTAGWTIDSAYGINNRGLIEAVGHKSDIIEHTLLLVPESNFSD